MAYLNTPIPMVEAFIRGNFLRDQQDSHDKKFPCYIFGMASIPGQAPLFHFIMEDGGLWWRMPIHAFCWSEDAEEQELDELVLWDSFSYYVGVCQFPWMKNKRIKFTSRRRKEYNGRYLFTLDWGSEDEGMVDYSLAEVPSQHKCGHFIAMDNGNFAIQPNNRLRVHDPSFCVKPDQLVIHRKYNTTLWTAERNDRWVTPDTDIMEYDHTDRDTEIPEEKSKEYREDEGEV